MSSSYRIYADALDENFLASLKTLYKGRELEITVEAEQDETERILANPALKAKLDDALRSVEEGNVIHLELTTVEEFQEFVRSGGKDSSSSSAMAESASAELKPETSEVQNKQPKQKPQIPQAV